MVFALKKVLISEPVDAVCGKILQDNGVEVITKINLTKEELLEEIKHYDGLVVRSATKVTADVIAAGKALKVIGRAGTGVDNIDQHAATRQGVLVLNAPGGNTLSAAELTCGMVVTLSRHIPQACASLKGGKWDRKSYMGHELQGKTLAIVGLGRIGREVAHRMQAFGMRTIGYDPLVPPDVSQQFGVESFSLEALWPQADYITVHVPLIPPTKNMFNDETLAKCKKGFRIVNCARGGIIDEDALLRSLQKDHCGGAGLDVYLEEPPKNTALVQHPKVICTPHLGASTVEAQSRVAEEISEQFVDLMHGKFVAGVVNSSAFCHALAEENQPWVLLSDTLGKIAAALLPSNVNDADLNLTTFGSALEKKGEFLRISALVGVLKQKRQNGVNIINALTLAQDAGYKITKHHRSDMPMSLQNVHSAITLEVSCGNVNHSIVGTVEGNVVLLCAIDGATFQPPLPVIGSFVLCHGRHSPQTMVETLGALANLGAVYMAAWTTPVNGKSWCVVRCSAEVSQLPQSLASLLDFCAQVTV